MCLVFLPPPFPGMISRRKLFSDMFYCGGQKKIWVTYRKSSLFGLEPERNVSNSNIFAWETKHLYRGVSPRPCANLVFLETSFTYLQLSQFDREGASINKNTQDCPHAFDVAKLSRKGQFSHICVGPSTWSSCSPFCRGWISVLVPQRAVRVSQFVRAWGIV